MQDPPSLDINSPEAIRYFVDQFYQRMLLDKSLSPLFLEIAKVDLDVHKPIICQYWEKLLFSDEQYQRHTMNIHRAINVKQPLQLENFIAWYGYFESTMDELYRGPFAEKAKRLAKTIARNMNQSFGNSSEGL